ncbi:MAG: NUDIX hydrolase [Legionellaceae bacterium]|nr:NUDIX hydrolase [Legionellaceae bacterium]
MNLFEAVSFLKKEIQDPSEGLPDDVFYFVSSVTPMINVDLLIKDESGRFLLSWRDDQYAGKGWHLPGGIVRFKETLITRLKKVAEEEIGSQVDFTPKPIAINEILSEKRSVRGHFISLLYECFLNENFEPKNKGLLKTDPGFVQWHDRCPDDLLILHNIYKKYL